MLESIVSSFLNRFLGDYFDNFSSDNLTVGLWNGEATVGQLNMTPSALAKEYSGHNLNFVRFNLFNGCFPLSL